MARPPRFTETEYAMAFAAIRTFAWWHNGKEVVGNAARPLMEVKASLFRGEYDGMLFQFGADPANDKR